MKYLRRSQASLYLDSLLLTGQTTDASGNVFTIKAQAEEATWSSPVPVDVEVQRWMTDGAVASTTGYENREPYFKVIISADTSAALAAGEDALITAANTASALAWVPPEGTLAAATTVFELWTVHLEHEFNLDQESRLSRTYGVRCKAKPWARSATLMTATALVTAGAGAPVSVDTCASTTGWTGSPNAPTTAGGAVLETVSFAKVNGTSASLTRAGSVTGFGTKPYLQLTMSTSGGYRSAYTVKVDGLACTKVGQVGQTTWWTLPAGKTSFTTLLVSVTSRPTGQSGLGTFILSIADVTQTDVVAPVSSHKQLQRALANPGSVTSSGSIQLASPSVTTLGVCMLYTCPDTGSGYSPPMRQYRFSGNTVTVDATCVSGNHEALVTGGVSPGPITYQVPPGQLPEATYAVVARILFGSANTTLTLTVSGFLTGLAGGAVVSTFTAKAPNTGGAGPVWVVLGTISLPAQTLPVESQFGSSVTINATGVGTHTLDELYLLDVTHGDVSLMYSVLGALNGTRVWIDAPDADPVRNRPAAYVGLQADRSDGQGIPSNFILALGKHDLDANGTTVLAVTDGVDDAVVTASFYPRWHTHAVI